MFKLKIIVTFVIFASLSQISFASNNPAQRKEYCGNLEKIKNYVDQCEKNNTISLIGLKCVLKLREDAKTISSNLEKIFAKGSSSQNGSIISNSKNLSMAESNLSALELRNKIAIEDILLYRLNLVYPEESNEDGESEGSDSSLRDVPCFSENQNKLMIALAYMDSNMAGITAAKTMIKKSILSSNEITKIFQSSFHFSNDNFQGRENSNAEIIVEGKNRNRSNISEEKKP